MLVVVVLVAVLTIILLLIMVVAAVVVVLHLGRSLPAPLLITALSMAEAVEVAVVVAALSFLV